MIEIRIPCHEQATLRQQIIKAGNACLDFLRNGLAVEIIVREYRTKRTIEQNAMLHGICGEIAKVRPWAGAMLDAEGWKRLLVDAWLRESGKAQCRAVPSLDGQSVVMLGKQTSKMTVAELSELIEFALAWAANNGVTVRYAA